MELEPYSIEESERAAGLGNYKAPQKRVIETLPPKAITEKIVVDAETEPNIKKARTE